MSRTGLAMVQTAARQLEARELPLPVIGADDALLRVEACGICGSDVESFQGVLKVPLPLIPGHEPLGVIETIGERAAQRWGVQAGDRVAVETLLPVQRLPALSQRRVSALRVATRLLLHPARRTRPACGARTPSISTSRPTRSCTRSIPACPPRSR